MKNILIGLCLVAGVTGSVQAQNQKQVTPNNTRIEKASVHDEARAETEQLNAIVNLTHNQRERILQFHQAVAEKRAILNARGGAEAQSGLADLERSKMEIYTAVLNEDQIQKLKRAQEKK